MLRLISLWMLGSLWESRWTEWTELNELNWINWNGWSEDPITVWNRSVANEPIKQCEKYFNAELRKQAEDVFLALFGNHGETIDELHRVEQLISTRFAMNFTIYLFWVFILQRMLYNTPTTRFLYDILWQLKQHF